MSPRAALPIALAAATAASPLFKKSLDGDTTAHVERIGWVSSSQRTTMDIIWNCLSIFIICSWGCVHHNLPAPAESQARYPTRKWARQLGYMVVVCLAPEVVVTMAWEDFLAARYALRSLREDSGLPPEVTREYSLAHAFFAQMGGFAVRQVTSNAVTGKPQETNVVCSLSQLAALPDIPPITREEIMDKSKSDALVKGLALVQCGWLFIQLIARTAQGLAMTELELSTMAFVLCALVIYILWWDKPFGVEQRIVITGPIPNSGKFVCKRREDRVSLHATKDHAFEVLATSMGLPARKHTETYMILGAISVVGAAFSAVHLAAWNWEFPSSVVRLLWRVSTMTAFTTPFLMTILSAVPLWCPRLRVIADGFNIFCLAVYCVARLSVIVLAFYCFSSMPASVYESVDWVELLPHFS
ncbi:hypothetical protein B0T14DRAFT_570377 [Immersiella caudata]|uniref:Transmembrane protein n=1 Tax=Immersiella caudata TaxID=314043 RepID=A0AA39WFI5_9PEZI|nr:hypothetical protein B0T14DRAFT_570377 [Immersiella caudata]